MTVSTVTNYAHMCAKCIEYLTGFIMLQLFSIHNDVCYLWHLNKQLWSYARSIK